jgi:hypothetical protein
MAKQVGKTRQGEDKLKVFISYSRAQVAFADQLELALNDKGHDVLIDRHSIAKGEDFQKRLGEMILACDTVVFILSDESAASEICAWEVAQAQRLKKRMLVVTLGDIAPTLCPPPALAGIDWIHCWSNPKVPGSSLIKGVIELDGALRTDIAWVRRCTDLQEQAQRWTARGAGADSPHLLRADVLTEALAWAREAPAGHEPPEDVLAFVAASEGHERRLKSKELAQARAVRRTGMIGAGVAAVFLAVAVLLGWIALRQTETAQTQKAVAVAQREVAETSAREARVTAARASFFEGLYWLRAGDNHSGQIRMEMWSDSIRAFNHGLELLGEDDGNVGGVDLRGLLAYGQRFVIACVGLNADSSERASEEVRTFFGRRAGMTQCGGPGGSMLRREPPSAGSE